jgi:DNA polymerase I-like protein with 3'-5' exonuclease and polymerase domains
VDIDEAGAQKIINQVAADFPIAWKWLEGNAQQAIAHERLENIFGRIRYFSGSSAMFRSDQNKVGREAKNFPIQSAVADLLAQAGVMLYTALKKLGPSMDMKVLLPIHDAFLFEVKNEHVPKAFKLIKLCMSTLNPLPGTEHRLGVDIEVRAHSWGDEGYKESQLDTFMSKHVHNRERALSN